jgi:hypothetical protein
LKNNDFQKVTMKNETFLTFIIDTRGEIRESMKNEVGFVDCGRTLKENIPVVHAWE